MASDGRRWTEKPPTHEEVAKPGLLTLNDSQGLKKHASYVKVDDPSLKKGKGKPKKGAEEKTYYVQVPEPDVHCWNELADLADHEKKRLLNGVLNLTVVWVQSSSKKLGEQGKYSVKEMVDIIKIDRIMLRLWHYMEFKYEEKEEWNVRSSFFRSKRQLLDEYVDNGLDEKLWNESGKFFNDTTYVNKCPQYLGCQHDNNVKKTVALVNDPHFPAEWKRVVLSVITGDRAQSRKGPRGIDECINILWRKTNAVTELAPFVVDPLNAMDCKDALEKLGHQLRSHTCVLDLSGTVDRSRWDSGAFASDVWEEPDVMHILFKGEDPRLLTQPVYEGTVSEDDAAALRRKQKVTPTDVEEKPFKSLHFSDFGNLSQRQAVYKEFERNPNQLCSGVESASPGKARLGLGGDSTQLEYTVQFVDHEVRSTAYACDFHHVIVEPIYDPSKDMFFKLTPKKRRQVYSFLFGHQPKCRFDAQYVMRKQVAIAVFQGYHGASRSNAVGFMKRLEYVFFDEGVTDPADFTLDNYRLTFGEDDDFNIETERKEMVVRDMSGGWEYDDRWDLDTFKSQAYEAVLHKLVEVNRRSKDDPALLAYADSLFNLLQANKWLEVSSAFYSLPLSPSLNHVSWELPVLTPPTGVVVRKSRGKDDEGDGQGGSQRGTGEGSEQRSTKQRFPGHEGGGEGKKGSREKKKTRSGEKTKHHRRDGKGSDVDGEDDGAALAATCSTSMETGNDFRSRLAQRPDEQDSVISSTSATHFIDTVGGTVVAKDGTCPTQLQTQVADCLGSIRTTETTSLSGTQCLAGSETTAYLGSDCDKLEPFSVSTHQEVRINLNLEVHAVKKAQRSTEHELTFRVSEHLSNEIRIDPNQEDMSTMTADWCKDAVMLCMEVHKELQADCPSSVVGVRDNAMKSLEGELAPSSNVQSRTLGEGCPVTVRASLTVLSDSAVKADMSAPSDSVEARMNPNLGDVSMSLDYAALGTAVVRMHPKQTNAGLELAGVEGCGQVTTFDKADGSSPLHSAEDRIDLKPGDVSMPHVTFVNEMRAVDLDQRLGTGYEDPLYSVLHDEAMGEDLLKKASNVVEDKLFYLSDDDKDTSHEDKKVRGGKVLFDIHGTLSPTQYDTGAMEKTQPDNVVDLVALSPERSGIKLSVVDMEDLRHREEFMPSPIIDADISNLSSFPGGLEHVIAASTRRGSTIVLGLPSVDSDDVEAKPGKH
ncbi:hypothetical protein CBR_g58830 [Chara braunii]|nr:hypothetical protein CBR_g58830 [Chara braunii]|eukprot:GBG66341.1 hypothetical protein CBR_g58830 [Chara braunii]